MREGQAKVLFEDEIKRVYAVAASRRHGNRDVAILDFSFRLGLRVKEISALIIDDVVEANGVLRDSFFLTGGQSKGDRGRTIYLSNKKLRKNLESYLDEREDDLNRHLFKSQKTAFSPNTMQMLLKRLYDDAGIKGAKSHSGRRTFATRLIEAGYDIKSVSVLMGHSSIQTTARYISENPIRLGEMVAAL
ncbi:MAG: site-specific integrase [Proteobacteria bacterium]|nr:site-specific integrase [Pseudomonadota bacterium]